MAAVWLDVCNAERFPARQKWHRSITKWIETTHLARYLRGRQLAAIMGTKRVRS